MKSMTKLPNMASPFLCQLLSWLGLKGITSILGSWLVISAYRAAFDQISGLIKSITSSTESWNVN